MRVSVPVLGFVAGFGQGWAMSDERQKKSKHFVELPRD